MSSSKNEIRKLVAPVSGLGMWLALPGDFITASQVFGILVKDLLIAAAVLVLWSADSKGSKKKK